MELEDAITCLKQLVKESAIKGQMHIDITLFPVQDHPRAQAALLAVYKSISKGEITKAEFLQRVGL